MKTVWLDSSNTVINVSIGEPESLPPEGITYMVVNYKTWVGPGCKLDENGNFYIPIIEDGQEL